MARAHQVARVDCRAPCGRPPWPCLLRKGHEGDHEPVRVVLGIDSGSHESGFAIVELFGRGRVRFVDGGSVPTKTAELTALLDRPVAIVAIEAPAGFVYFGSSSKRGSGPGAEASIAKSLIETSFTAGRIAGMAQARGRVVVVHEARVWRASVVGNPSATDAMIAQRLKLLTERMPTRSSVHVRDAIGVATLGAWQPDVGVLP